MIQGRHESLISEDLFDQVQTILDERGGNGERQRRHHHYLKGTLWCGRCHDEGVASRMIMQWANGNGSYNQNLWITHLIESAAYLPS
jgi:hypothetical protein